LRIVETGASGGPKETVSRYVRWRYIRGIRDRESPGRGAAELEVPLATFNIPVSSPIGHPLFGGRIKQVVSVDDHRWLRGVVPMGADRQIALAAPDWTDQ
jgi:hypothetical protein